MSRADRNIHSRDALAKGRSGRRSLCCRGLLLNGLCFAADPRTGAAQGLRVWAIDAAQPFDFEHRAKQRLNDENRLKIGIVGFGTFGQFLARRFVARGHQVRTPASLSRCSRSRKCRSKAPASASGVLQRWVAEWDHTRM